MIYDSNDTMRKIGEIPVEYDFTKAMIKALNDIEEAHGVENNALMHEIMIDAFSAGYLYGKTCIYKHRYIFDGIDASLSGEPLTPSDVNRIMTGSEEPMTESELIQTAADMEYTLYRVKLDDNGEIIEKTMIYEPNF